MAVHFVDDDPDQRCEPRHTPVSRAEVLRAALTEPCPDCLNGVEAIPNGIGDPIATGSCRTCDGRGWLPIDGVALQTILTSAHEERYAFVVPLSMLEGDDT